MSTDAASDVPSRITQETIAIASSKCGQADPAACVHGRAVAAGGKTCAGDQLRSVG